MKNIIKNLWILIFLFSLGSCTSDFLDVNKDPNSPTTPELNQLLSGSQYFMVEALGQGYFIGDHLSSYVHHTVAREAQNYGMGPQAGAPYNTWNYLYTFVLKNYDAIIEYATKDDNLIYAGIAKTLKAYTFSVLVDLWGDVPYSEFNVDGLIAPKADESKDIYNSLLTLLEEGRADLLNEEAENMIKPGADDFFYAGDVAKWVRVNNTIKLRLLLQSRKAKSDIIEWQKKFDALITENNFIKSGEDFQFWYNEKTNPTDMRHPAFVDGYFGQHTFFISPYFYETMMGQTFNTTDNPFSGIKDPRVPYYFYNQLAPGADPENAQEYRNGDFLSIFFASNGPNSSVSNDKSFTKIGIYPCGGKYDDGAGGAVSLTTGTGVAPHKLITYSTLKFMLAELILTGETTGDAKETFSDALKAAIAHVNSVVLKQAGIPTIADDAATTFINSILAKYDAADANGKMRIVMTQKWIASFMNPIDSYNDYRRTGYPTLFDPNKTIHPGFGVNLVVGPDSPAKVPLMNIASYPRSLYYPTDSETELNPNIEQKINISKSFVFWDK